MTTDNFDPKKALQISRIIYFSMLAGILFFMIMVFYVNSGKFIFNTSSGDPVFIVILVFCCIAIPSGYLFAKNLYNKIDPSLSFREKYPVYQSGLIIRLASCEGVALLCIVNLLISGNLINLFISILPLSVFISYFPTPEKIGREINLTPSEIEQII